MNSKKELLWSLWVGVQGLGLVARARTQLREVEGVVLFIEVETACVRGSTNQIQVV